MNSVAQWLVFWQVAPFALVALFCLAVVVMAKVAERRQAALVRDFGFARFLRRSAR